MRKTILVSLSFLILTVFPAGLEAKPRNESLHVRDYKKGYSLYQQGRYEEAQEFFERALDGYFGFWQAYQMIGYCYFETRRKAEAMRAFEESLEINPDNPKLWKIYHDLKTGALDIPLRPVADASAYYMTF